MATCGEHEHASDILGSEDICDLKCQPCQNIGELQEAVGMCLDCQEFLCKRCYDVHKIPTPCQSHQLLDKQHMLQSHISLAMKDRCTEKCTRHEDEIIKYNCTRHCQLGCSVCITLDHRDCKRSDVTFIPDAANDLDNNEEYQQMRRQFNSILNKCHDFHKYAEKRTESIEDSYAEILKTLHEQRNEVIALYDKFETNLMEKMDAIKSKEIKKMAELAETWKQQQEEMENTVVTLKAFKTKGQNCSAYTGLLKSKDKLGDLEAKVKEMEKENPFRNFQFKISRNREILKAMEYPDAFGTVSVGEAEHIQGIPVKSGADTKDCWITGLVFLPDGTLVVTDFANGSIKAVDVQRGRVTAELGMTHTPWAIAMTGDNHVAVTLPDAQKIVFVTLRNTLLSVQRELEVHGTCTGIDYKDGKLAVSFTEPDNVKILDLHGQVLYSIPNDNQGNTLSTWPSYVSLDRGNDMLYVSNCDDNNVVRVNFNGTVVGTYTNNEFKKPRKAIVHKSGDVFVCIQGSNKICQISPESGKIVMILSEADGIFQPYGIHYSDTEDKFYVGMSDCNTIKVYRHIFKHLNQ